MGLASNPDKEKKQEDSEGLKRRGSKYEKPVC